MKFSLFVLVYINLAIHAVVLAADVDYVSQSKYCFPWEIAAERFNANKSFCTAKSKDANSINYAIDSNVSIVTLPPNVKLPKEKAEVELSLSKWQENQWTDIPPIMVRIDPNGMVVDDKAIAEGFYKLSLVYDKNDVNKENNFYAVFVTNWKPSLLTWCKKNKEHIETNADSQLIYSSIAVSHFDNLMELVSKSPVLSENIFSALPKAITAKKVFTDGNCPDLFPGLNKIRLKRFEGSVIEEFVVFIPETYNKSKPEAVFLYPDNSRWATRNSYAPHSGLIDIWWHTVDDKHINWKNFEYFFDVLKHKLNIDENRVYVYGECNNGLAAMSLALNFPDMWAECSISLGNTYRHLSGNALNLPLIFVKGGHNENYLVGYYDFAVECFKYHGCRYFKHSRYQSDIDVRGKSVPDAIRDISPVRVLYTIESLANARAYWVQIDGRKDENFIASIDAIAWGQSILIKTDNVDAYTLNLEQAPLDCNRPVEIIENGKHIDLVTVPVFVRKSEKYKNALYIKGKSLHGPVSDILTDRYVAVWKGDESIKRLAGQLAGSGPCFADANFPADFINTHNIIFVGMLNESKHFAQISGRLPVIVEDGKLTSDGKVYEGDFGTIFIYPNPLNPQKYIAIFSGTTGKALSLLKTAWDQIKLDRTVDIGIFKAAENNQLKWDRYENFDTVWGWHKDWSVPLAKPAKTYPKWKWQQWAANVLRRQLKADVVILEEPLLSEQLPDAGELTLRDISKIFKNDWVVKISLKGSDLRELLTVDISSRESVLAIDGASLVKAPADSNVICISELDKDKLYTVVLPYKAINGLRMGMVIKNYCLEGEGFMVVLLRDYLRKDINIDAELDNIKSNML